MASVKGLTLGRRSSQRVPLREEGGASYLVTVDMLVKIFHKREFQEDVGIAVSEVFKGGSVGQGTQVRHNHDIDLVIYSDDLTVEDILSAQYRKETFEGIQLFLRRHSNGSQYDYHETYVNKKRVIMGIQFIHALPENETITVDLSLSPRFSDHHDLLRHIQANKKERKLFSEVKWQTYFIARQDQWVKEFCRRAKAWRDLQWDAKQAGSPKSYFISILVVTVYHSMPKDMKQHCQPGKGSQRGKMKNLVPMMTEEFQKLVCEIDKEGQNNSLDLIVPVYDQYAGIRERYHDLLPPCPRIADPVNPSKNLYHSGIYGSLQGKQKWAPFVEKIHTLDLSSHIMKKHEEKFKLVDSTCHE